VFDDAANTIHQSLPREVASMTEAERAGQSQSGTPHPCMLAFSFRHARREGHSEQALAGDRTSPHAYRRRAVEMLLEEEEEDDDEEENEEKDGEEEKEEYRDNEVDEEEEEEDDEEKDTKEECLCSITPLPSTRCARTSTAARSRSSPWSGTRRACPCPWARRPPWPRTPGTLRRRWAPAAASPARRD